MSAKLSLRAEFLSPSSRVPKLGLRMGKDRPTSAPDVEQLTNAIGCGPRARKFGCQGPESSGACARHWVCIYQVKRGRTGTEITSPNTKLSHQEVGLPRNLKEFGVKTALQARIDLFLSNNIETKEVFVKMYALTLTAELEG